MGRAFGGVAGRWAQSCVWLGGAGGGSQWTLYGLRGAATQEGVTSKQGAEVLKEGAGRDGVSTGQTPRHSVPTPLILSQRGSSPAGLGFLSAEPGVRAWGICEHPLSSSSSGLIGSALPPTAWLPWARAARSRGGSSIKFEAPISFFVCFCFK